MLSDAPLPDLADVRINARHLGDAAVVFDVKGQSAADDSRVRR